MISSIQELVGQVPYRMQHDFHLQSWEVMCAADLAEFILTHPRELRFDLLNEFLKEANQLPNLPALSAADLRRVGLVTLGWLQDLNQFQRFKLQTEERKAREEESGGVLKLPGFFI